MSSGLLRIHIRCCEIALRMFQLHLLWLLYSLRGGVVLGVFPATAAVHSVLRRDRMDPGEELERPRLRHEFGQEWRHSLGSANAVGYLLTVVGALLLIEQRLLASASGGLAAGAGALLWFLLLLVYACFAHIWVLHAHYEESAAALVRRCVVMVIGRPRVSVMTSAAVGLVLCGYYVVPGLVPVLGVALPAFVGTATVWSQRLLPHSAATRELEAAPNSGGF